MRDLLLNIDLNAVIHQGFYLC